VANYKAIAYGPPLATSKATASECKSVIELAANYRKEIVQGSRWDAWENF